MRNTISRWEYFIERNRRRSRFPPNELLITKSRKKWANCRVRHIRESHLPRKRRRLIRHSRRDINICIKRVYYYLSCEIDNEWRIISNYGVRCRLGLLIWKIGRLSRYVSCFRLNESQSTVEIFVGMKGMNLIVNDVYSHQDLDFIEFHTEGFHVDKHAYGILMETLSRDCLVSHLFIITEIDYYWWLLILEFSHYT